MCAAQRIDMVVDDKLVVEVKATSKLPESATRQLYNYLHATNLEVGLLLHFGTKPGIHREICPNTPSKRAVKPTNPINPPNPPNLEPRCLLERLLQCGGGS